MNNIFEAISSGAVEMIHAVGAILANLIAFVAIFAFLDAVCVWFFGMLSLQNFGLAVRNFTSRLVRKKTEKLNSVLT